MRHAIASISIIAGLAVAGLVGSAGVASAQSVGIGVGVYPSPGYYYRD